MHLPRAPLALGVLVAGFACSSDEGGGPNPPTPASVTINAGQTQVGPAGQALATQLAVIVRDASSNPLANVAVTWAATSGGGSVSPTMSSTNASGIAATTRTLGANAGAHTTTATVAGLTPVTFNAVAQIQGATQIAVHSGNNQSDTVQSTLAVPLAVIVRDQTNAPVQGVFVNWTVLNGGMGSFVGGFTDANGITSITRTFGTVAGPQGALATVNGLAGSPATFTLTATAGHATALTKTSGDNGAAAPSSDVVYTVTTRDNYGNASGGVTIDWAVGTGGGSITPAQNVTAANGTASATRTMGAGMGAQMATATATGLTGSPATFTTTAANVANVTVGGATNAFNPPAITITVNTIVIWTWAASNVSLHNVTFSTAGAPAPIGNQTTGSASRTFTSTGTFSYSCLNHLGMNGSVTVTP